VSVTPAASDVGTKKSVTVPELLLRMINHRASLFYVVMSTKVTDIV